MSSSLWTYSCVVVSVPYASARATNRNATEFMQ